MTAPPPDTRADREAIVRVERLTRVFGRQSAAALALLDQGLARDAIQARTGALVAVRDVSFEVRRGELFVLMGLSGSGKSTVLRLLNGLTSCSRGSVQVDGRRLDALRPQELRDLRNRRIGMVFQHFALFAHRTILENAAYGLKVRGVARAERERRARAALAEVGLEGWADAMPHTLSGGMQQRVGIARVLACDTDVMLMDEPFSALDPLSRRDMQDLLLRLHRESGRTIVFVTHDLNEAMRLGERILIMQDGAIAQLGTASDILCRPAGEYVARFIADIDRTRVLRAGDLTLAPAVTAAGAPSIAASATLAQAAQALRGVTALNVQDETGRILGALGAEQLRQAIAAAAPGAGAP